MNGIKLLPWIVLSPELDFDIVVDVTLLPVHETAEIQAKTLDEMCAQRSIPKSRIVWMVADNASVNKATVDILRTSYGYRTRLARCIDHSLALTFTAFSEPFEQEFHMKAMLRHIRSYIKSGGGASRRATLVEHALTMSGMDFADTRWGSFFRAVEYMMGVQTARELKSAREQLETMSKWGDASAAEALKQPDVARSRWTVIAEALESMGEDANGREQVEVKEVRLDALLDELNSWKMFSGFYACSKVFTCVPALFTVLQGDERFEPQLDGLSKDGADSTGDIIAVMKRLLSDLEKLSDKTSPLRDVIVAQTRDACESRLEDAIISARRDDEPLLADSESFDEADVATFRANAMASISAALADVKRVIVCGAKAFKTCKGMKKLKVRSHQAVVPSAGCSVLQDSAFLLPSLSSAFLHDSTPPPHHHRDRHPTHTTVIPQPIGSRGGPRVQAALRPQRAIAAASARLCAHWGRCNGLNGRFAYLQVFRHRSGRPDCVPRTQPAGRVGVSPLLLHPATCWHTASPRCCLCILARCSQAPAEPVQDRMHPSAAP